MAHVHPADASGGEGWAVLPADTEGSPTTTSRRAAGGGVTEVCGRQYVGVCMCEGLVLARCVWGGGSAGPVCVCVGRYWPGCVGGGVER